MTTCVALLNAAGMQGNECQSDHEFKHYQQHQYGCKYKYFIINFTYGAVFVLDNDVSCISHLD
jgi:hypothetical protein